jgi:hypothetical protein
MPSAVKLDALCDVELMTATLTIRQSCRIILR